jgi:formylglycine-generating enzyme required for sulfatase activity
LNQPFLKIARRLKLATENLFSMNFSGTSNTLRLRAPPYTQIGWPRRVNTRQGNSGDEIHPVKQMAANALYDMLGNVFEWCSNWHGKHATGWVTDPIGPSSGFQRVVRGG